MPQLNPEFFISQLFWLVVTFSFLLIFLWRISLPRIGSVLDKRQRKISEDLATAKKLQAEAENIQEEIDSQLVQARSQANDIIKKTSNSLQNKAEEELENLDKELDLKINDSSKTIEKNKQESLENIENQINYITKLTLSKIIKLNISDEEIKKAVKSVGRSVN
tara:strand:- start:162 stop:653 length:492 start_codon:yes stop_codon:yes gene_type:complete